MSRPLIHFAAWLVGLATAETQTTIAERACLTRYAAGRLRLAEIGVWHGVTTSQLRAAMAADGILFAVDPYPVGALGFSTQRFIAHRTVSRLRNGTVKWLRMTGGAAARDGAVIAAPMDFVFIDGDHSYGGLQTDWESWSGLIASGGVVGLHDSRSTPERPITGAGSVRYTQNIIRNDRRFRTVDEIDSLTVLTRVSL